MVDNMGWFLNPRTKMTIVRLGYNPGSISVHPYRRHLYVDFIGNDGCRVSTTIGKRVMKIFVVMTCEMQ